MRVKIRDAWSTHITSQGIRIGVRLADGNGMIFRLFIHWTQGNSIKYPLFNAGQSKNRRIFIIVHLCARHAKNRECLEKNNFTVLCLTWIDSRGSVCSYLWHSIELFCLYRTLIVFLTRLDSNGVEWSRMIYIRGFYLLSIYHLKLLPKSRMNSNPFSENGSSLAPARDPISFPRVEFLIYYLPDQVSTPLKVDTVPASSRDRPRISYRRYFSLAKGSITMSHAEYRVNRPVLSH